MPRLNQTADWPAGGEAGGEACADAQSLAVLELAPLLERVAGLAQSELGAALVRSLRPCPDLETVERRQRRLEQLRRLLWESEPPSLAGLADLAPLFSRLEVAGAFLTPEELQPVVDFLGAVGRAASFLDQAGPEMDELVRLANRITPLDQLARRIRSVLGPGGSVASSASPALADIRSELARCRDRLRNRLNELVSRPELAGAFSDQVVTQRADRFVVPVRTDNKGRLAGIIHDTSGSGATCFLEPLEVVEDNNQLALLRRREREEEIRVLQALAAEMGRERQALGENLQALAQLDCLLAQAEFCRLIQAQRPELNREGELALPRARHPLLAWRARRGRGRAVPVDIHLDGQAPVLVISGANAGGKTAALKTAGLITLMAMCGLAVPAAPGCRVAVFHQVLAELGDEQDLDRDLSTFTAHAGRLARMARMAGPGCLILVDELGAGTDPGEGAALGMALLRWFRDRGARVMCTTHFHGLKAFAASTPGVMNVSVCFDRETGRPTYQLTYGQPGFSDALAVARGLGFPSRVLAWAEAEVDAGERRTVALLQQAQEASQRAREELDRARARRREAEALNQQARQVLAQARKRRAQALDEGRRRVREVARRLQDRLEKLWEESRREKEAGRPPAPGRVRQEFYRARRQALEEVNRVLAPPPPEERAGQGKPVRAGDVVRLLNLNQRGVVLEDPRPGAGAVPVSVGVSGVRVLVPLDQMEPLPPGSKPPQAQGQGVSVQARADDGLDLKIIGLRVDEALPLVDKALDRALLAGRSSLRIVHGVGTGRLGRAVREFLDQHPLVVSRRGGRGRGGAGVTVAELREEG